MRIIPPNSVVSASFSQNIADMRARATIVSQESVTGQYADLTKHLGGRIGDAMVSNKVYKAGITHAQAVEQICAEHSTASARPGLGA